MGSRRAGRAGSPTRAHHACRSARAIRAVGAGGSVSCCRASRPCHALQTRKTVGAHRTGLPNSTRGTDDSKHAIATRGAGEAWQATRALRPEEAWRPRLACYARRTRNTPVASRSAVTRQSLEPQRPRSSSRADGAWNASNTVDSGARLSCSPRHPLASLGTTQPHHPCRSPRARWSSRSRSPCHPSCSQRTCCSVLTIRPRRSCRPDGACLSGRTLRAWLPSNARLARRTRWAPFARVASRTGRARSLHVPGGELRYFLDPQ